jgi:hypothetical protein
MRQKLLVSQIIHPPFSMFFDISACHMDALPLVLGLPIVYRTYLEFQIKFIGQVCHNQLLCSPLPHLSLHSSLFYCLFSPDKTITLLSFSTPSTLQNIPFIFVEPGTSHSISSPSSPLPFRFFATLDCCIASISLYTSYLHVNTLFSSSNGHYQPLFYVHMNLLRLIGLHSLCSCICS